MSACNIFQSSIQNIQISPKTSFKFWWVPINILLKKVIIRFNRFNRSAIIWLTDSERQSFTMLTVTLILGVPRGNCFAMLSVDCRPVLFFLYMPQFDRNTPNVMDRINILSPFNRPPDITLTTAIVCDCSPMYTVMPTLSYPLPCFKKCKLYIWPVSWFNLDSNTQICLEN